MRHNVGKLLPNVADEQTLGLFLLKLAQIDHLGIFNQLSSTQNGTVARFTRNIK